MITIPTTNQLFTDIKSDLETAYGSNIPVFGKVFLYALALVQAAKLKLFYLAIASVQKNIFVDTADPESAGGTLERFGRIKINRNPFPATAGKYTLTVAGVSGATIPARTIFKSNDDSVNPGKIFIIDTDYVLPGSTGTITVRALEAGLESKMAVSEGMTATSPITNVSQNALVAAEVVAPVAAETIDNYRSKVVEAFRLEPEGGSPGDYRIWASDAQGALRVYPYAVSGSPWQVNLFVEATIADSTDGKGTPSVTILNEVIEVVNRDPDTTRPINERGRRPIGVILNTQAITPLTVNIEISDFVGLTAAIESLIEDALVEFLSTVRPFIAGADTLDNKNDILDLNKIVGVILQARPGSIFGAIEMTVDGNIEASHTFIAGDIPSLGTITYV
jgi:uncharacterized phage protein gp47/JayE